MQHHNTSEIREKLIESQARLAALREIGVFWIVPQIQNDWNSPNAKRLVFRRFVNGKRQRTVDEKAKRIRNTSLPLARNKARAERLLEQLERTKEAERLIEEIEQLQEQLQEIERKEIERMKQQLLNELCFT